MRSQDRFTPPRDEAPDGISPSLTAGRGAMRRAWRNITLGAELRCGLRRGRCECTEPTHDTRPVRVESPRIHAHGRRLSEDLYCIIGGG